MSAMLRRRGGVAGEDARELARLVAECTASDIPRSVLIVRLSSLPRGLAQPHHLRLARAALDPLTSADRARLFQLENQDLIAVWRGDAVAAVIASRKAITHLFADDAIPPDASVRPGDLVEVLSLPADARPVLAAIEASIPPPPPPPVEPQSPPLDLGRLAALEVSLQHADLARFARRRPVGVLEEAGAPEHWAGNAAAADPTLRLAWEKRVFSMEELGASLMPDRSPTADRWLFRRLSRTLDRRMLALLSHPEEVRRAGPFSLNLNVSSILGAEFLRFDETLPARLRGQVVLELSPGDVMADPASFLFAREFAQVRGYALALRGLTPILLKMFPRELVGVHWLRLHWTPELAARSAPLGGIDPARVILGRVDSAAALAWGRAQGVTHFCGQAIQAVA